MGMTLVYLTLLIASESDPRTQAKPRGNRHKPPSRSRNLRKTYNRKSQRGYVILVAGTLCIRRRQILVLRRSDGIWDLPKGVVKADESISQGAIRETKERTGLTPLLTGRVNTDENIWIFQATLPNGEIKLSEKHTIYEWLPISKAQSLLYPSLARIVGR